LSPGKAASGAACAFITSGKQAAAERITANMTFRFFIDLVCSFFFLAFSDLPGRVARHSQGESGTILIISSRLLISVSNRFAKNAGGCQSKKQGDR
jgi:hypothetical protein